MLLTGQADGNPPPDAAVPATVTVRLHVTVPLSALAGASDEPGDLDHVVPWPDGPTTVANLVALCRRHHRLKTSGTFQISTAECVLLVSAPLRRRYTRPLTDAWQHAKPA